MQQTSPLLQLPPELRNHIYRLTLLSDGVIDVTSRKTANEPALLATCKEIRSEAFAIHYAENSFSIHLNERADIGELSWLETLGSERCKRIKHLQLRLDPILTADSIFETRTEEFKSIMQDAYLEGLPGRTGFLTQAKDHIAQAGIDKHFLSFAYPTMAEIIDSLFKPELVELGHSIMQEIQEFAEKRNGASQ